MKTLFQIQNHTLFIAGIWDKKSVAGFKINDFVNKFEKQCILDFVSLEFIDMAGVRFFLALEYELRKKGVMSQRVRLDAKFDALFALCEKNYQKILKEKEKRFDMTETFVSLGKLSFELLVILRKFICFVGAFFSAFFVCLKRPKDFRFIAFLYHIENSAFKALPIVILTALLVGVVLAYQAAFQLAQFGANIFIVDLVGISATRELAPLIAAIVIAGRSASSYTAQIGVMKITDEIAAMNTMGFSTFNFIIIPRVTALIVAMPLIVAVSDFISILGGMVVAQLSLDINFAEFLRRFKEAVDVKHIIIGLVKAPIFGFLIGLIACFRGLEVKHTTQSIGIYTTKSVVNAIFWVIAFDALFSIILTQMGV
ncbi:ABC transporter permease [Campylobacter helveticus]|uniref:ABC transporter permease n=1 Tax=Campylobacter helveticus TaxID=28898 RepID=UPI002942BE6C|nr:ABC transporter permease [Campylobacter helveticus]